MNKTRAILLLTIFLASPVTFCLADEKEDHVCFRRLDSNKDGLVTFEEFEKFYENAKEKFHEADKDADGKLTHDEYHDILGHGSL